MFAVLVNVEEIVLNIKYVLADKSMDIIIVPLQLV